MLVVGAGIASWASPSRPGIHGAHDVANNVTFYCRAGFMQYMRDHFDLSRVVFVGASASGLLATLTACGVEPRKAVEGANQIANEAGIWDRTLGLLGIWGRLVETWLDRLLPQDAAQQCSGRVCLLMSQMSMRGFRHAYVDECGLPPSRMSCYAALSTIHVFTATQ
jgi:hypothetical protein